MDRQRAGVAAESLPSEVASLDATGAIIWANTAWVDAAQSESGALPAGGAVGVNFLRACRATGTTIGQTVAAGIAAVIAGERDRFEHEYRSADGSRRWKLQASSLRGSSGGAVLLRTEITGPPGTPWNAPDPADLAHRVSGLTPRERDVLRLMVQGLSNREIAAELGIAYTTVRTHAQAVIEKLDARSRLQAVARAYRAGILEER